MLMSQNLSDAKWSFLEFHGKEMKKITLGGTHYPLMYEFSEYPLSFRTHGNILPRYIREELLVHCQAVIVSLAGSALDKKFLESDEAYASLLRQLTEMVCETKLPTVVVLDIWQPDSSTVSDIRSLLKIPQSIPILPYSYHKPVSIQNILTTLLECINNLSIDQSS